MKWILEYLFTQKKMMGCLEMAEARNSAGRLLAVLGRENNPGGGGGFFGPAISKVQGFGGTPWTVDLGRERYAIMRHIQLELERFKKDCKSHLDDDLLEAMQIAFLALDSTCYQQSLQSPPVIDSPVESYLVLASKKIPIESEIEEDFLSEIQSKIDNLAEAIDQIESDELSSEFEKILTIASQALDYFAINGAGGLEEAVHRIMAKMYKLHESKLREEVEASTAWAASKNLIVKLDKAVSSALKIKAIASVAKEYMPWMFGG